MHHSCLAVAGIVFAALASAKPFALPSSLRRYTPRSSSITWSPCEQDASIECGRFEVPLDYQNESAGKASLAVTRYRATRGPKLGTLFLNPGGPGGSGVDMILGGNGDIVMETVGGQYDLVGWDPRGVGDSDPQPSCFATLTEEIAFWNGSIALIGIEARGNFADQADLDAFYSHVSSVDELLTQYGQRCHERSQGVLQYVGTTATVRDLVALHDYIEGQDKPINYWGMSYGTIIGIYLVNMFPDRAGRVVLDGVTSPLYWANKPSYERWAVNVESADEALTGFLSACAMAGPTGCALATNSSTTDSLREDVLGLIDLAYNYKKKFGSNAEISFADLREFMHQGMYTPTRWPSLATQLHDVRADLVKVMNNPQKRSFDLRSLPEITKRQTNDSNPDKSDPPSGNVITRSITCADAVDPGNTTTRMVFDWTIKVAREVSPVFGPVWNIAGFVCHKWPARAVERYAGLWNKNLSNPILVIGINEADPVTPFINAKYVADALGDSAILIQQDDYGHVSLAMKSNCTTAALNSYFLHNKLPSADVFCGTNQILFPGPGITKSTLSALSGSSSSNLASSNSADLETELNKVRERSNQLFIAVVALACATVLLLLSLIASFVFGRRKKDTQQWIHVTHDLFEKTHEDQGHVYATPYDPAKATKKDGYAPVQT
ncbi:hypothetical protein FRC07_000645 [Ceratobasidium sp. 392]|nr:hypothetical protein FRC07_000645 [Ceratobasidium sp. 392]